MLSTIGQHSCLFMFSSYFYQEYLAYMVYRHHKSLAVVKLVCMLIPFQLVDLASINHVGITRQSGTVGQRRTLWTIPCEVTEKHQASPSFFKKKHWYERRVYAVKLMAISHYFLHLHITL